jgi:tRNA nucleotidyltransferase (CCA-adding enzyme)
MNEDGNVYDFHGGTQDIGAKIIRCVGSPRERFKEDPIRILRAIRLAVTLGFDIHDDTFDEMIFHRMLLLSPSLSLDRMKNEINRALAVNPHRTLELLDSIDFFTIAKLRDENFRIELVNRK